MLKIWSMVGIVTLVGGSTWTDQGVHFYHTEAKAAAGGKCGGRRSEKEEGDCCPVASAERYVGCQKEIIEPRSRRLTPDNYLQTYRNSP
jgi:hypothetical protein